MLSRCWKFLKDKENRAVLQWVGMAVIAVPPASMGLSSFLGFASSPEKPNVEAITAQLPAKSGSHYCVNHSNKLITNRDYMIQTSSAEPVDAEQVILFNKCEAWIAKNEIFARNGYIFKKKFLNDYFKSKSWYEPGGFNGITPIEDANVAILTRFLDNSGSD